MSKSSSKRLRVEKRKHRLLVGLRQVRSAILEAARAVRPQDEQVPFLGEWCIGDLLAHLVGWDVTNLQAAQEILDGHIPSFYSQHDKDWASYNRLLVARYKEDTHRQMIDAVGASFEGLLEYLHRLPAAEMFKDRGLRVGGYKVVIGRLIEVERKDEQEHLEQIRAFISSRLRDPD